MKKIISRLMLIILCMLISIFVTSSKQKSIKATNSHDINKLNVNTTTSMLSYSTIMLGDNFKI